MVLRMAQLSNKDIKSIKALASKKFRDETGLFVVEGEKMVQEALDSRFEVTAVYRRDEIGEEAMSRISQLSSPSPVLAVVRKPADIDDGSFTVGPGLYLALDSIRDPGNLKGNIIVHLYSANLCEYLPELVMRQGNAFDRRVQIHCSPRVQPDNSGDQKTAFQDKVALIARKRDSLQQPFQHIVLHDELC